MMEKIKTYITRELKRRGLKPPEWKNDTVHFDHKDYRYTIIINICREHSSYFELHILRRKGPDYISHLCKNISLHNFKEGIDSEFLKFKKPSWSLIKCATRLLSVHQRAVVTANHPLRKLERGEFNGE